MASKLRKLFLKELYQELLDQLVLLEEKGDYESLNPDEQVECEYYRSRALLATGQGEKVLQLLSQIGEKPLILENDISKLIFLVARLYALTHLNQVGEALTLSSEGDKLVESFTPAEHEEGLAWIALFYNVKGNIWRSKDKNKSLEHYQQSLTLRKEIGDQIDTADSLLNIGLVYRMKGEMDKALDYFQQSLSLYEASDCPNRIISPLVYLGIIYRDTGKMDKALDSFQRLKVIGEVTGDLNCIADALYYIGSVHDWKGDLDTALDSQLQAMKIYEKINNPRGRLNAMNEIANLYISKDDLDSAMIYYPQMLKLSESLKDGKTHEADALVGIGDIYRAKGERETAMDYIKRGLAILEKQGHETATVGHLYGLVELSLEQDRDQSRIYLEKLEKIHEQTPMKHVSLYYKLAKGLFLKHSGRMKDKAEAQTLLREIIEETESWYFFKNRALLNLCEILLVELKSFNDSEVLEEVKQLIEKMHDLARVHQSFSMTVRSLILKAKLSMVEGNLVVAKEYLEKAKITAESKDLGLLAAKAEDEMKLLEIQYDKWEELVQNNAPFKTRLEQAKLEEYVKEARILVSTENLSFSIGKRMS